MKTKETIKTHFQKGHTHHILLGVFCGMVLAMMSMQYFAPSAFAKWAPKTMETIKSRWDGGTSASVIFDNIIKDANQWETIQDTAIDEKLNANELAFDGRYRIANTVDSLKNEIAPYLQRFLYATLSIATILIIITGFQLVTSSQSSYDTKKAISKLKNIAIWVGIFTGVYVFMKLFLVILVYILK